MPPPNRRRAQRQTSVMGRIQLAVDTHIRQRYPLMLTDLSEAELKMLIAALDIDNTPEWHPRLPSDKRAALAIEELPGSLKKNKTYHRVVSKDRRPPTLVCPMHNQLNPFILHHLFDLIDIEITDHLWKLKKYTQEPSVRDIVQELIDLRRMWVLPEDEVMPKPDNQHFQRNRCEACIIVKIIDDPMQLQNLRSCLLAREYQNSRPPRLLQFVDKSIFTHRNRATSIYHMSDKLSWEVFEARKEVETLRQMSDSRKEIDSLRSQAAEREAELMAMQRKRMDAKTHEIIVYMDPKSAETRQFDKQDAYPKRACGDTISNEIIGTYATSTEGSSSRGSCPSQDSADNSSSRTTNTSNSAGIPDIRPLSIRKERSSIIGEPRPALLRNPVSGELSQIYNQGERPVSVDNHAGQQEEKIYLPPREGIEWSQVIHRKNPLDDLIDDVEEFRRNSRVEALRPQSQIAIQYSSLPSPQASSHDLHNILGSPVSYLSPEDLQNPRHSPVSPLPPTNTTRQHDRPTSYLPSPRGSEVYSESEYTDVKVKENRKPGPSDTTWSLLMRSGM
ncbi:hypothetical protein FE257_010234 [Aspergillus nanangensis]|uniref:Uncharacterized protein n=1 Tax=Aspergillus nanangensis TaxID=2582783 RepID=A0AAD4CIW2_ASPNN|nr:hypothetical protein FE257_010234 [Aspergillus nanangensis]